MRIALFVFSIVLVLGLATAGHASLNLPEIVKSINGNSGAVPPQLAGLFGDQRINVHLEDTTLGIVTERSKIIEYSETAVNNPTMEIYTNTDTLRQMLDGKLSFSKALKSGKIKYSAVDTMTKIKLIIAEIFGSAYSVLTGRFTDVGFGLSGFVN